MDSFSGNNTSFRSLFRIPDAFNNSYNIAFWKEDTRHACKASWCMSHDVLYHLHETSRSDISSGINQGPFSLFFFQNQTAPKSTFFEVG